MYNLKAKTTKEPQYTYVQTTPTWQTLFGHQKDKWYDWALQGPEQAKPPLWPIILGVGSLLGVSALIALSGLSEHDRPFDGFGGRRSKAKELPMRKVIQLLQAQGFILDKSYSGDYRVRVPDGPIIFAHLSQHKRSIPVTTYSSIRRAAKRVGYDLPPVTQV